MAGVAATAAAHVLPTHILHVSLYSTHSLFLHDRVLADTKEHHILLDWGISVRLRIEHGGTRRGRRCAIRHEQDCLRGKCKAGKGYPLTIYHIRTCWAQMNEACRPRYSGATPSPGPPISSKNCRRALVRTSRHLHSPFSPMQLSCSNILQPQGNLSWSTTADNLKAIMETAAPVTDVEVQTHSDTGRSKGWA